MLSPDDLPGRMSRTHDLNDLQRRVQRESSSCGTSSLVQRFFSSGRSKLGPLPLRVLRHGFIALSIPAALVAGTAIPAAQPAVAITPVAASYAVQSSLSAFIGDGAVAEEAVADEFVFDSDTIALGAPVAQQYAPVAVGVANLRSGPSTSFERIAKLQQGQTVRLLGRNSDWFKVETKSGQGGWLHSDLVDVNSAVANQLSKVDGPAAAAAAPSKVLLATTTDSRINLRKGPSTSNAVIAQLAKGVTLEVIGRQGSWVKVATNKGTVGWITEAYLAIGGAAPAAPAAVAPAAKVPTSGKVSQSRVNLRKGPNTQFGSYGKMAAGTALEILARSGDWLKVRSPRGTIGWVAAELVNLNGALAAVPVSKDVPALPKPAPAKASVKAPTIGSSHAAAGIALKFIGSRYVYGGASPKGFDCSGLTSYVYRQLGVNLPHKASMQFSTRYGQRVSMSQLAPGDLVFFANTAGRGITHVALYVGNGMMVSANTPRLGVQYVSIYSKYWQSHFAGAIRPYV